jgi:hypothetical protein
LIKAQTFHEMVYRCLPSVEAVLNFDEVPMSLSGSLGRLRTVTHISDKDVRGNFDAGVFKRSCTVICTAGCRRVNGEWVAFSVKPIILLKGEPQQARVLAETYDNRVVVAWTKKGVITTTSMLTVIVPHLRASLDFINVGRCLVILDSAKSHVTPSVVTAMWGKSLPAAVIPAGCTSWLQWVDTHCAAVYRSKHTEAFRPFAQSKMTAAVKRRLVARLVADSFPAVLRDIAADFETLGYTDPSKAKLRNIEYNFNPPALTNEQLEQDKNRMNERIIAAQEEGAAAAVARPPAPAAAGKKAVARPIRPALPVNPAQDLRRWFAPKPKQ